MIYFSNLRKSIAFLDKDWHTAVSYKLQFFSSIFGVVISTMIFYFMSNFVSENVPKEIQAYGGSYFSYVIIGIALADFLVISTESFSSAIRNGQVNGTFEALLVTPTSILIILFSSYIYPFLFTTVRILTYMTIGALFCGVQFHVSSSWLCIAAFVLTLLPFWGLGLLSAAFIIVFKQGSPVNWILGVSSTLLGGIFYPISSLPAWLEPFSNLMPLTYGVDAIRKIVLSGAALRDVQHDLIILLLFSVIFILGGVIAVNHSLRVARKNGTLLHY